MGAPLPQTGLNIIEPAMKTSSRLNDIQVMQPPAAANTLKGNGFETTPGLGKAVENAMKKLNMDKQ